MLKAHFSIFLHVFFKTTHKNELNWVQSKKENCTVKTRFLAENWDGLCYDVPIKRLEFSAVLPEEEGGLLPDGPGLDGRGELLDKVEEHAAEGGLDQDDDEAGQDLPDAGHDADRGERDAGPHPEEDGHWKKKQDRKKSS